MCYGGSNYITQSTFGTTKPLNISYINFNIYNFNNQYNYLQYSKGYPFWLLKNLLRFIQMYHQLIEMQKNQNYSINPNKTKNIKLTAF